jgi:hypothetical protein
MGKDSERTAANSRCSQNNGFHSCEAHDLGGRPQEDRSGAAGSVGEGEGGEEEGGVDQRRLLGGWRVCRFDRVIIFIGSLPALL